MAWALGVRADRDLPRLAPCRNANFDYRIKLHEKLDNRFRVMESIGKGSFGQVVRAYDELEQKPVAIKIIKNKDAFRIQAKSEMELLKLLNVHDPGDQWSIVRMKHTFMHHGHTCLVFELLSINLYQLLRRTSFQGVSLNLVRKFARQILKVRLPAVAAARLFSPRASHARCLCAVGADVGVPVVGGRERHPLRPEAREHPVRAAQPLRDQGH